MQGAVCIPDFLCTIFILKLGVAFFSGHQVKLLHNCIVLSDLGVKHTTHSFYHELPGCAIDACTKKIPEFSERVCIDTFKSVRKERVACIHRMQNAKGLGISQQAFCNAKMAFV